MLDIVLTGGTIVDGTGSPGTRADLGISGEKIDAIGDLSQAEARRVIDATGLTVSPGFIDSHTHSDAALLVDPQHASGLRQGVTTEVLGQDGLSYAPLSAENYRVYRRYLAGILGEPPENLDMSSVTAFRSHYHKKTAINTAYLVAHGAVRLETLGFRDVPLTGDHLKRARRLIRDGIEQGAVGFATGLSYHPNAWSDTNEMVELCEVVHEAGGVYVTHLRDVNTERGFGGGGVAEALEIGRRSGVAVHFSHYRTSAEDAGRVAERLELIDEAKAQGVDCTLELYPYPTGSSFPLSLLPSYAHQGGPDAIIRRLKDPTERAQIVDALHQGRGAGLRDLVLSYLPRNRHLEGLTLRDIAGRRGTLLEETLCDMLIEEDLQVGYWGSPPDSVALWRQVSRDCLEFLSRPDYMVGSDSIHVGSLPHPRAYGTFPRFLGRLRRQFGVLSLEQMVQRMTDNPARRFGLTRRGRIERGYFADIAVFDPERIIDNATYDDPHQFPTGVPFVLVNGRVALDQERCTGVLAGQAVP
jgi:N-acyl-D-amino-acid deacylase